ncbi:MAG: hypothetical protein ACRELA_06025 [Candidatus Rokuibacteriota bacterium]
MPKVLICPQCGSFRVEPDPLTPLGQIVRCLACSYQGAFVIEADDFEEAVRIQAEIRQGS